MNSDAFHDIGRLKDLLVFVYFHCRGYICDHCMSPAYVQPIGCLFTIFGLIILGPAPYIPKTSWVEVPNLMVTTAGLCFMGIGTAALLVSPADDFRTQLGP
jgi:hypothetical protein